MKWEESKIPWKIEVRKKNFQDYKLANMLQKCTHVMSQKRPWLSLPLNLSVVYLREKEISSQC